MMWATTSSSSYAGTCIFLVILGVILLSLVSSRSMLEKRWSRRELNRRHVLFLNKDSSGLMDKSETLLTPNGLEKDIIIIEQPTRARRSWKTIMLKATMTTLILAILYIQMIFIMTENIGYILSILGGVFLGTLVMGRYAPRATDANLHHT
ncbi:hypothetical protein N7523_008367 [Penicillium sp. IBT 18751x]|nr:hypothetical protein N7523_008367 [Penicillium sp. IBT 18751x]